MLPYNESFSQDEFRYAEFSGNVHLSCFGQEIHIFGKFSPKNPDLLD